MIKYFFVLQGCGMLFSSGALASEFMASTPANNTSGCVQRVFKDERRSIPNPYKSIYETYKEDSDKPRSEWSRESVDFTNPNSGVYYNPQYIVHFNPENGLLVTENGDLLNTPENTFYMFIVGANGNIYTRDDIKIDNKEDLDFFNGKQFPNTVRFAHSSFGIPLAKAVGEWQVKNGVVISLNNRTGHYAMCTAQLYAPNPVDLHIVDFAKAYCAIPHNGKRKFKLSRSFAQINKAEQFFSREGASAMKSDFVQFDIDCSQFPTDIPEAQY